MKRKIAAIIIIAVLMAGCTNGLFCKNKNTVIGILNGIIATAQILKTMVPATSPIVDLANTAINLATAALQKNCPTDADIAKAQEPLNEAMKLAQAQGLKLSK